MGNACSPNSEQVLSNQDEPEPPKRASGKRTAEEVRDAQTNNHHDDAGWDKKAEASVARQTAADDGATNHQEHPTKGELYLPQENNKEAPSKSSTKNKKTKKQQKRKAGASKGRKGDLLNSPANEKQQKHKQAPSQRGGQSQDEKAAKLRQQLREYENQIVELKQRLQGQRQEIERQKQTQEAQEREREDKLLVLRDEQQRVARLKLQTQLREKELAVARQQEEESSGCTRTYVEGKLFKFGKQGKLNPKEKWVQVNLLGANCGHVVLDYCESQRAPKVDRSIIEGVQNGEKFLSGNTAFYKGRVFAVKLSNQNRQMVFACDTVQDCDLWVSRIQKALDDKPENLEAPAERVVFEITFEKRPLGFSVDMNFDGDTIVTSIQDGTLDLVHGVKVISANGQDFRGKNRSFIMDYLKWEACPLTIRFEAGPAELQELDIEASADPSQKHRPAPSMQDLYPNLTNNMDNHPLVKDNEEFKIWLTNPSFKLLLEDLTAHPEKLQEYLDKDL